jgi:SpoIIAA-like
MIFLVPIHYRIDPHRKRIWTACIGNVNPKEIKKHFRELAHDPTRPDRLNVLLDLTEMTSLPETDQLRVVSKDLKKHQAQLRFNACAIVASRSVLFGMMRMFQALAQNSFRTTQVFSTAAEAEAWLAAQEAQPESLH